MGTRYVTVMVYPGDLVKMTQLLDLADRNTERLVNTVGIREDGKEYASVKAAKNKIIKDLRSIRRQMADIRLPPEGEDHRWYQWVIPYSQGGQLLLELNDLMNMGLKIHGH